MKKIKILGVIALVLAALVLTVGILADFAKKGDGAFADALKSAREISGAVENNSKAVKNLSSLGKKTASAQSAISEALQAVEQAQSDMEALDSAMSAGAMGDDELDKLRQALMDVSSGAQGARAANIAVISGALDDIDAGVAGLKDVVDARVLALYQDLTSSTYEAAAKAETAVNGARSDAEKVLALTGAEDAVSEEVSVSEMGDISSCDACRTALDKLIARTGEIAEWDDMVLSLQSAAADATNTASKISVSFRDKAIIALSDNFIGVLFTAVMLLLAALVMIFMAEPFKRQWVKNPTFSVGIALIVMMIFQTYALGFGQGSIGAWAKFWFDNTFNVLRANTSVGIIALGMTLVIITGGIDLAVGSTLAGVGTVLMAMIDTGSHGFLVKLGITGVPAFAIGIAAALLAGAAIGGVIGLLVTKGRIPPFIVTLGVMNVVRSVSQYFTKSYTPTVPNEFEAIANTMVLGQRPMTIIYWLVLAVLFYLMMKHTAFGRYVYAVGSNERTTRLSGINTNKVKLKVYMLCGLVVAIASVTQLSRLGGMDVASAGNGYELDAIAAVVVGGTAMSGGRGSIIGTILGVLIIGIMNNLLILLGVDSFLTDAFKGAIVVIAVLMQRKEKLA